METTLERVNSMENHLKKATLTFNMETEQEKRKYRASSCPFCIENIKESDIVLTDGVSFLRKNKMPNVKEANMYVLVESLIHEQHLEEMDTPGARGVLSFAFESMEWARKRHEGKTVLLLKNRGLLSGGSQPHPHMQVVALQDFNPAQVDFSSDRLLYENEGLQIGMKTEGEVDLYQFLLRVKSVDRTAPETVEALQKLLNWVVNRHGNYNLAHFQQDGHDIFKIIPRWVGAVYGHGYSHYMKYDESELELIQKDINELFDFEQNTKKTLNSFKN